MAAAGEVSSTESSPLLNVTPSEGSLVDRGERLIFSPPPSNSTPHDPDRLPVWRKLTYAIGAVPYAMCNTVVGFYLSIFLLEVAILDPTYVLLIVFSGRVWDAITDPTVGFLCNRTRTRLGRLRPWLLGAMVPTGLAYTFLWFVPPSFHHISSHWKFLYYLAFYFSFQLLLTCIHVPYTSLTMHLSHSNKERDSATLYRMVFEVIGTLLGIGIYTIYFTAFVHTKEEDDCSAGQREPSLPSERAYRYHAITLGVLTVAFITTTLVTVREQKDMHANKIGLFAGIRATFSFLPFLYLFLVQLFGWLAVTFVQGNFALYVKYSLDLEDQYPYVIAVLLIATICWMPLWQLAVHRIGKKAVLTAGLWIYMLTLLTLLFIDFIGDKAVFVAYPIAVVSGAGIATAYLMPWSMLPDVIDEAYLKTGVRREELFYAFFVFGTKFAGGVTLGISTGIYKAAGYDENKCDQPWTVALTLKLLVSAPPIIFALIGLFFLYVYPINEKRRERTRHLLQQRRKSSPTPASTKSVTMENDLTTKGYARRGNPISVRNHTHDPDTIFSNPDSQFSDTSQSSV
jgi:Na+/melibiose symporter-like transporter